MTGGEPAIVLFDGVCNLCVASVRFAIRRDPRRRLRFAALGSRAAAEAVAAASEAGLLGPEVGNGIILIERGRIHRQSSAALRMAGHLRFPWWLLAGLLVVPRPLRNVAYAWVARNRFRWFGRRDACLVPSADVSDRFLTANAEE